MTIVKEGILVPLDVLLDTRIATVARHFGDEAALKVLEQGYHTRLEDAFPGIELGQYKRLYKERDSETLPLSTLTNVFEVLVKTIAALIEQAREAPFQVGFKVVVNTHPYDLDPEEISQIAAVVAEKLSMLSKVGIPIEVEALSLPLSALTPNYCKTHFKAMFMYEYEPWLAEQQRALIVAPIPEITLIVPAIYHEKTPTISELRETIEEISHPFHVLFEVLRPFVRLELIAVSYFSILSA